MRLRLHYFWIALQLAVVFLVNQAFRIALVTYLPTVEEDHPVLCRIADVVIIVLLSVLACVLEQTLLLGNCCRTRSGRRRLDSLKIENDGVAPSLK